MNKRIIRICLRTGRTDTQTVQGYQTALEDKSNTIRDLQKKVLNLEATHQQHLMTLRLEVRKANRQRF